MTNKILVISAVFDEIKYLLKNLKKDETIIKNELIIEKGILHKRNTDILITGPGILNAVHALTLYLENNEKPDLIIQTGCAGGFPQAGADYGDVGIATNETYIHLGVENPEQRILPSPLPFSLTKTNSISNIFNTHSHYTEKAFEILGDSSGFNVSVYPFITVSEVTSSKEKAEILYNHYAAGMENMEGAGSAYVAFLYEIPFIEIRSVSNETGVRDKNAWEFQKAFTNSCKAVSNVVKYL